MLTLSGLQVFPVSIHERDFKSSLVYSPTLEKYIFKGKRIKAVSYHNQSPIIKGKPILKYKDF